MRLTEEQIEGGEIAQDAAEAFIIAIAGLVFAFMGDFEVAPGSLRVDWAIRAIGTLVALAGGIWFVRCMRRLHALKQRRERTLPPFRPDER